MTVLELEKILCRLVHLGLMIPTIHHFLSIDLRATNKNKKKEEDKSECETKNDLKSILTILERALKGVNMNQIAFHLQSHVYRSDFCSMGLGGYRHKG